MNPLIFKSQRYLIYAAVCYLLVLFAKETVVTYSHHSIVMWFFIEASTRNTLQIDDATIIAFIYFPGHKDSRFTSTYKQPIAEELMNDPFFSVRY
ncbi:MAG: hypothetical protein IPF52_07965 [Saprospiraceae bacterium]|nr:hypothetical protein [Saprospiraceae bacterium]